MYRAVPYPLLLLVLTLAPSCATYIPHVLKPRGEGYELIGFAKDDGPLTEGQIFTNVLSTTHDVNLKLTRTVNVGSHVPVFTSADGVDIRKRMDIPDFGQDVKFYQDVQSGAAMSIRKSVDNKGRVVRSVEGTMFYGGDEYLVQPASDEQIRHKRSLKEIEDDVDVVDYHIMVKMKKREDRVHDYVSSQLSRLAFTGEDSSHSRQKRATPQLNTIELFMAVDFALYSRFLADASGSTSEEKQKNALSDIKYYMCHLSNGLDIRFQSIKHARYSFRVQLSFIYIAQTALASPFTENYKKTVWGAVKIPGHECLAAFKKWTQTSVNSKSIPKYDYGVLNTGYELLLGSLGTYSPDSVCKSYNGIYRGQAMSYEPGAFGSTTFLAQGLAFGLGARVDNLGTNGCDPSKQFILGRYLPDPYNLATRNNTYRFSSCSISAMASYVASLNRDRINCMLKTSTVFNETEFQNYLSVMPGQQYTIHQQCKQVYGEQSYFCGGSSTDAMMCYRMYCYSPTRTYCLQEHQLVAADGTTCGNKKWCLRGYCVYDERAPKASDTCPSGDRPGRISKDYDKKCSDIGRWECYTKKVRAKCCGTCVSHENLPDCEYGDKVDCSGYTPSNVCRLASYRKRCCFTCRQFFDCEPLSAPVNGIVSYFNASTSFGSQATYSCYDGFELQGIKNVRCLINGTWESTATPQCNEITTQQPPTTQPPTTQPPTTQPPTTQPPTTQPPTTQPPTTQPPTTQPPTTQPPTTQPPTTQPPTTQPPTTQPPTTQPPTTQPPTTQPPTTQPPTTQRPRHPVQFLVTAVFTKVNSTIETTACNTLKQSLLEKYPGVISAVQCMKT